MDRKPLRMDDNNWPGERIEKESESSNFLLSALALGLTFAVVKQLPEIRRYLKMRSM